MRQINDPTSCLKDLVAFETVSHRDVMGLANFLASAGADLGFDIKLYADAEDPKKANVVCRAGPVKEGGLIISGHMDVVPTEGQPWQSDPFSMLEREGKLFGRGTADMKGFIACTLAALTRVNVHKLREPLVLIWTYDEEVGCKGSHKLVKALEHDTMPLPTEALIGEPTDFRIFRMHPGHVSVKIVVSGQAAHSSKPDLGASAIRAMSRILELIETIEEELKKEQRLHEYLQRPYVTLNVGAIKGGQAVNIVPDYCEIILGYRPLPGDEPLTVFERIKARIMELPLPSGIRWDIEQLSVTPALLTKEHQPLEHSLAPFAIETKPSAAAFATDGGNLARLGISSLIFGPGSIDVAHKANEFIEKSALLKGSVIVEKVIRMRCE